MQRSAGSTRAWSPFLRALGARLEGRAALYSRPIVNQPDLQRIAQLLSAKSPIKWVFAGDSITHGAGHTMGWRDYVELFGERVRWEMQRRRDCVIKTGVSGWRVTDIRDDLDWSVLQHRPQVVSIAVGMNDCTAGAPGVEAFRREMLGVVSRVRDAAGSAIVLHAPNRILPADAQRAGSIEAYANAVRAVAAAAGCALVDHWTDWEPAARDGSIAFRLSDAIHPNEYGHRSMARAMFRALGIDDPSSRVGRLFIP